VTISNINDMVVLLTRFDERLAVGLVVRNANGFVAAAVGISRNAPGQLIWYRNIAYGLENIFRTRTSRQRNHN
jgi:hypothetical protein